MYQFNIDYPRLIKSIQNGFIEQGKMKPVNVTHLEQDIDLQLKAYKEVYGPDLQKEWAELFPGMPFNETIFEEELARQFQAIKKQEFAKAMEILKKQKKYLFIRNWIFRKWTARLWISSFISIFTIPGFLILFFTPNNLMYHIGALGLLINIIGLGYLLYKTLTDKED